MENKSPFPSEQHRTKKRPPATLKGIVPKLIVTSNEKFIRRCLELVLLNASKEALIPGSGNPYPRGIFVNYPGSWIIGTISSTTTMSNILTNPLYKSLKPSSDFENSVFSNSIISCSNSSSSPSPSSPSSSSSFAYPFSRGILRCTWNHGIPHYTLSVDGRCEAHTACFSRIENTSPDFVYLLRSNPDGESPKIAAKMSVLTSLCFAPDGAKVKETEFVLSEVPMVRPGPDKVGQFQKRSKGLTERVVGVLKGGHNLRRRTFSKFDRGFSIREPGLRSEPDPDPDPDQFGETLAVVVREDVRETLDVRPEVGGWGMKFLRRRGGVRPDTGRRPCSTVIVPAGFHSGPRSGGPSGLVERWRAGGSCDCGGWDVGCPLEVFETCSIREEDGCGRGRFENFEVFKVGRVRNLPTLRIEKIYEDLYRVQYGPGFSTLQSFSIALAMLHTLNPGHGPGG